MSVPFSTHLHGIGQAIRYFRQAQTIYDVHSPFLAKWITEVLEDQREYYVFEDVVAVRAYWLRTSQTVSFQEDYGAGSRAGQGRERSVAELARWSAVDAYAGALLFRMVLHAQPQTILELGTNLGFSAMYMRAAALGARFTSIEGQAVVAKLAAISLERAKLPPIDIRTGTFAEQLPQALADLEKVDFAFLDGDHRGAATIGYFNSIRPHLHGQSVVVIGDIHWSDDMLAAWEEIREHPMVSMSVDLYHFGVLFFRKEQQEQEHFTLIKRKWKPWRLGFF